MNVPTSSAGRGVARASAPVSPAAAGPVPWTDGRRHAKTPWGPPDSLGPQGVGGPPTPGHRRGCEGAGPKKEEEPAAAAAKKPAEDQAEAERDAAGQ